MDFVHWLLTHDWQALAVIGLVVFVVARIPRVLNS